eukprot:TRINITY_DN47084_c0_g1_i1.p1 TRINITY_DN47084_c0_g1~~TRINITY_DN47084_c0_g1_i1.p1  ORF type:complete len:196 (-),score=35.23 TRINITY_DN47084_c0_g1_i1:109-696(-)
MANSHVPKTVAASKTKRTLTAKKVTAAVRKAWFHALRTARFKTLQGMLDCHGKKLLNLPDTDSEASRPLSWAAAEGKKSAAEWLLKKGADVDGRNRARDTPLILAAAFGQPDMVRLLIRSGANLSAREVTKMDAVDSCINFWTSKKHADYKRVLRALVHAGAKIPQEARVRKLCIIDHEDLRSQILKLVQAARHR